MAPSSPRPGSTITPRCNTATIERFYCTSLFNPNPNDPWVNYTSDTSGTRAPITKIGTAGETQNDANTIAAYAFDSITLLPQLILNLGARVDRFTSTLIPPGTPQTKVRRRDTLFNYQVGLVGKPTPDTSIYASYATAATPPNSLLGEGSETNGTVPGRGDPATLTIDALKVQKTKNYEVGAKAALFAEKLQLTAALFQTDISNARVTVDANTVAFLGKTRIRGLELSATGTIVSGWTIFGGYTHLDPKIVDGGNSAVGGIYVPSVNTGKQVPQTARNSFTATTNVTLFKRLQIGGSAIYMDTVIGGYADNRTAQTIGGVTTVTPATKVLTREVPSYWRFDARASLDLTKNVQLSVNAQNVTDKIYFNQAYTSHYASIAPGRTVFGTIGVKF